MPRAHRTHCDPELVGREAAAVPATNFLISSYLDSASCCLVSSTWMYTGALIIRIL